MFAFSRKLFSPLQCDLARNYFYFSLTWTSNHQLFLHPYTNVAHFWLVHQWGRVVPIVVDSAHMWADHKGDPERLFLTVFLASKQAQLHLIKRVILFILLVWFLWLLCMSLPVCWLIQLHRRIQNLTVNNNVYSQTLFTGQIRCHWALLALARRMWNGLKKHLTNIWVEHRVRLCRLFLMHHLCHRRYC